MMNCLVTGGAGFIGSHLVEALVRRGDKVRVFDNLCTGSADNLRQVRDDLDLVVADVADRPRLRSALDRVDVVFHFAVSPFNSYHTSQPVLKWLCDLDVVHVLIASREANIRRFVYASSCNVYGRRRPAKVRENDPVLPLTAYGLAKLAAEHHCVGFTALYGLETVRLRYFDTFGPRQCSSGPYARSIPAIVRALLAGRAPTLDDDCLARHDFIHVDDVIHATLAAAEAPRVSGNVYNIACGRSFSQLEVVRAVNELLGTRVSPLAKNWRHGDALPRAADISRAEADLGFCPAIDLRRGLQKLIDYYAGQDRRVPGDLRLHQPHLPSTHPPHPIAPASADLPGARRDG